VVDDSRISNRLSGVYYTGAGVNPARALAPDVINTSFPGYHWIYWLGPFLGSLVASVFYYIFKRFGYQTANPGQDASNELICLLHHDEETPFAVNAKIVNLSDYNRKYTPNDYEFLI
jgi:aquaporin rerated protein, other eukaryote